MEINILNRQNTVLNKFIAEIRDRRIQCDSMRFRRNLERIGELMAYEISKRFRYTPRTVETPHAGPFRRWPATCSFSAPSAP